jgi:hypothetical protein
MGWNFRRGLTLGPFRINLSRKGAGASVGIKGFRIGQDASGRNYSQVSIPGTGIYRRDYYKTNSLGQKPGGVPIPVNKPIPATQKQSSNPHTISPSGKYLLALATLAALVWSLLHFFLK